MTDDGNKYIIVPPAFQQRELFVNSHLCRDISLLKCDYSFIFDKRSTGQSSSIDFALAVSHKIPPYRNSYFARMS